MWTYGWGSHHRRGLRVWVLQLLERGPMNGAELMEQMDRMTMGWWRPSPGSIYPLLDHLVEEEEVVFPKVLGNERPSAEFFRSLKEDHEEAGALLAQIRHLAGNFTVPEWACSTYKALMEGLSAFEQDLHLHIHLENNVLFQRFAD